MHTGTNMRTEPEAEVVARVSPYIKFLGLVPLALVPVCGCVEHEDPRSANQLSTIDSGVFRDDARKTAYRRL
jgi:hypothetical protein